MMAVEILCGVLRFDRTNGLTVRSLAVVTVLLVLRICLRMVARMGRLGVGQGGGGGRGGLVMMIVCIKIWYGFLWLCVTLSFMMVTLMMLVLLLLMKMIMMSIKSYFMMTAGIVGSLMLLITTTCARLIIVFVILQIILLVYNIAASMTVVLNSHMRWHNGIVIMNFAGNVRRNRLNSILRHISALIGIKVMS